MIPIASKDRRPAAPLAFVRHSRLALAVALGLLALALGALGTRGLAPGLDFAGGVLVEAEGPAPWRTEALRRALTDAGVPDAAVQLSRDGAVALVRAPGDAATLDAVRAALGPAARIRAAEAVGPRVSAGLLRDGAVACAAAVTAIGAYVWLRFDRRFGVAALATTLFDVTMLLGFYAVTGLRFDLTSVAATLAVAGYSINDTVVVFDRIRETLSRAPDAPLAAAIDAAITDTLRRTLITSATTLAASGSLALFGGPALFGFAAAVTVGVALGTLSSIFVAAPLLLRLPAVRARNRPEGPR